jgi:hypothetical protein
MAQDIPRREGKEDKEQNKTIRKMLEHFPDQDKKVYLMC